MDYSDSNKTNHKDLIVWRKSIKLVKEIYLITKDFPLEERYGITSQMRRAAVSIPSNIAEGSGRFSLKEFVKFLYYSIGSSSELETQLIICHQIGLINDDDYRRLDDSNNEIIRMLTSLASNKRKLLESESNDQAIFK